MRYKKGYLVAPIKKDPKKHTSWYRIRTPSGNIYYAYSDRGKNECILLEKIKDDGVDLMKLDSVILLGDESPYYAEMREMVFSLHKAILRASLFEAIKNIYEEEGDVKRPYERQKKNIKRYQEKKGLIGLTVDKKMKARWQETARRKGISLTRYIIEAVEEYSKRQ